MNIQLDEQQITAIRDCCDLSIRMYGVTGEAGTGKTEIIRTIYERLTIAGYQVALCAPTGKAAKRIQEATGIQAVTIHRLLEYAAVEIDKNTGKAVAKSGPSRCRSNPLPYDVVIADEYAMVNSDVHRHLIDALANTACFRAFGDANQLKPITDDGKELAESPFQYILRVFRGTRLLKVYRQNADSGIAKNAVNILANRFPQQFDDFKVIITDYPVAELRKIAENRSASCDFASAVDQIIVSSNKTFIGTIALNAMLQAALFPKERKSIRVPRYDWDKSVDKLCVDDKVLWRKNDYNLMIFNGESGIIKDIDQDTDDIWIDFGDRTVCVPRRVDTTVFDEMSQRFVNFSYDPRKNIQLAFAITTHASQGSQYRNVVYVINKSASYTQSRANFYTGVSRARERVVLIADRVSINRSLMKV